MKDKGKIIKQMREAKEFSQDVLAKAIGKSVNTISQIERGDREITDRQLNVFALVLEKDPTEISRLIQESEINNGNSSDAWAKKLVIQLEHEIAELKKDKEFLQKDKTFLQQVVTTLTEKVNVGKLKANYLLPHNMPAYHRAA